MCYMNQRVSIFFCHIESAAMYVYRVEIFDFVLLSVLLFGHTNQKKKSSCISNAVFQYCGQICPGVQCHVY